MKQVIQNGKKTILVTGATGAEGGSVARALLRENKFQVRILTRNPQSQKAQVFKRAGAEIVAGDFNDIQSLKKAMEGCYGVYGVTNFREHFDREYQLGKNLVDAVHQSGIEHFVFQSQANYRQLSGGRYPVPHYDNKAKLEEYTRSLSVPATFIHAGFYYENFLTSFPLQKDDNREYYFGFPQGDTKLAMASVEDLGKIVTAVFNHPAEYKDRIVGVVGADLSCDEYAAILSEALGRNIYYTYIPRNVYAAYNFPGAEELANMFEVQRLHIPNRQEELEESNRMNPGMQSFAGWVEKNKLRFINYFNSQFEVMVI